MLEGLRLHYDADDLPTDDVVAFFGTRSEAPAVLAIERVEAHPASDERTRLHLDQRQWTLDSIEDALQQPRTQLHRQRQACPKDRRAGAHSRGFLVDLRRDDVAVQTD